MQAFFEVIPTNKSIQTANAITQKTKLKLMT